MLTKRVNSLSESMTMAITAKAKASPNKIESKFLR